VKIYCVCQFCSNSSSDEVSIEINFTTGTIFYICPHCKKENKMVFKEPIKALPRMGLSRMR
jgi:hypothetical protein